ncbi:Protein of unknown function (DUF2892) [Rhodovulum imhoffii]|uniref:Inner membrane protein YgaP-like transmembrane domain-containing protein n=1 Tax=Rhodovulum imhoffii TaxID=365340 RepID=A0A2T5BVQ5_9RHOB|nr:DUF2892 domain-containing protein [Rhodovulum imhoffii]MBK5933236.1 hypothetical protein [Rhodovulum imhoffii]PTN03663.1 Protein of unknown function (DUF2892) [Rhodovulum imhoffii]
MFTKNVGGLDRIARIALGVVMIAAYVLIEDASWLWLLGIVPLATGLMQTCPLYNLIGMNTCPKQ